MYKALIRGFAILLIVSLCSPLLAQDSTAAMAKSLSEEVTKFLKNTDSGQQKVRLGDFAASGPSLPPGATGGGIVAALQTELGKERIDNSSTLELRGNFFYLSEASTPNDKFIKVTAQLLDTKKGEVVREFQFKNLIKSVTDIVKTVGASGALDPSATSDKRREDVAKSIPEAPGKKPENPTVVISGSEIHAKINDKNFYGVELRSNIKDAPGKPNPQKPEEKDGLPFVPLNKGEVYVLRIINSTSKEVGVSVAIDGVDMFHLSETFPNKNKQRYYFVEPNGEITIEGWHRNTQQIFEFLVDDVEKGVVSQLKVDLPNLKNKIGTITVGFNDVISGDIKSRGQVGTAEGVARNDATTVVDRKVEVGASAFITLRYGK